MIGPKKQIPQKILNKVFDALQDELHNPSLQNILENIVNIFMEYERALYLDDHPEDSANGFYERNLHTSLGTLRLKVPRVRIGNAFRPRILPPRWQRVDRDYEELLLALLANGYSRAQIASTLKRLGLPYHEDDVTQLVKDLQQVCQDYQSQQLDSDWLAVFIDAFRTKMRDPDKKVRQKTIYSIIGIDLSGTKRILGFYIFEGREKLQFWTDVLEDLYQRGLRRVLLFVSDDFPGLASIIPKFFPSASHQLCLIHMLRNLKRLLPASSYAHARRAWKKLKSALDAEDASSCFDELISIVHNARPSLASSLAKKKQLYTAFALFPEPVRPHIYSTNPVESIHAGLRFMESSLGGYFPSRQSFDANLYIQIINTADSWNHRPVPMIRKYAYDISQLFSIRFLSHPSNTET